MQRLLVLIAWVNPHFACQPRPLLLIPPTSHMSFIFRQLCFFAVALACDAAAPTKLGDLDGDGLVNVYDLTRLRSHIRGTAALPENLVPFADVTGDGFINEDDAVALINTITGRNPVKSLPLASIRETSPFAGESTVALTREVIVRFTQPLSLNTVLTTWDSNLQTLGHFYAEAGGAKLRTRVELSGDREKATLFFLADARPNSNPLRNLAHANRTRSSHQ